MSLAEVKLEIEKLTDAERLELAKFLQMKRDADNPGLMAEMGRRLERVRAGHYYTQEDLERIHAARVAEGQ
jgi:hypothetical protein